MQMQAPIGCGVKNIYDLINKEIKVKQEVKNMQELTKPQNRKYKIGRANLHSIVA